MKLFRSILLVLLLQFLVGNSIAQRAERAVHYSVALQLEWYKTWVFSNRSINPSLRVIRDAELLDVGLLLGFRHRAYGDLWSSELGTLPTNLISDREAGGQFASPLGDALVAFQTSRFFQTYYHVYLGSSVLHLKRFHLDISVSPGIQYGDIVIPISRESVHFVNNRPTSEKYHLYTLAYKRYLAYGICSVEIFQSILAINL